MPPTMSYQVLARKYRPRTFGEVVGQDHAVRTLMHALDADRLHHAYLFTGTRGVGKTTLARAFAKCLNCEAGVSARSCGECSACEEIASGRFVDLIEVDAASRTRVDDTRELLDNVQYLPSRGRYKVYLIDEVHMLSASSFNALLKTLEEPPPHVKFLLATTDPKKVPVTVLSRCLQFHLKNILPERIAAHLQEVLEAEGVEFEAAALDIIAEAAQGSMRDALSVTDQAIAFGGGALREEDVASLLGTVRGDEVAALLGALADGDRAAVLRCAADLAERNADFMDVLAGMQRTLHDVAMGQTVGGEVPAVAQPFVSRISPEDVQLYYQIALMGGRDLQFAPDPRVGFEMTLIRMLAFRPEAASAQGAPVSGSPTAAASRGSAPAASRGRQAAAGGPGPPRTHGAQAPGSEEEAPVATDGSGRAPEPVARAAGAAPHAQPEPAPVSPAGGSVPATDAVEPPADARRGNAASAEDDHRAAQVAPADRESEWYEVVAAIRATGMAGLVLANSLLVSRTENAWELLLDEAHDALVQSDRQRAAVQLAVSGFVGREVRVIVSLGRPQTETPAARERRIAEARQKAAEAAFLADANVRDLLARFDGRPESVGPAGP